MNIHRMFVATGLAVALAAAGLGCDSEGSKVDLPSAQANASPTSQGDESEGDKPKADRPKAGQPSAAKETPAGAPQGAVEPEASGRRLSGAFEPQRKTNVAASVGGIVQEVFVDEGDVVQKGDKLINIDGDDYRLRVQQAKAALDAATAQVDTLETEFGRIEQLRAEEAVSQSEVDQLSGQLTAARAQKAQAEVGLRMARKALSDALVRAPYGGVITRVNVAEGDFATPGPQPLVELQEVQQLYLRVRVPEEYARQVDEGDELQVYVPALEKNLELAVTRINPVIADASRSFDVLAGFDNSGLEIRPGMYAEITLAKQVAEGAGQVAEGAGGDQ